MNPTLATVKINLQVPDNVVDIYQEALNQFAQLCFLAQEEGCLPDDKEYEATLDIIGLYVGNLESFRDSQREILSELAKLKGAKDLSWLLDATPFELEAFLKAKQADLTKNQKLS